MKLILRYKAVPDRVTRLHCTWKSLKTACRHTMDWRDNTERKWPTLLSMKCGPIEIAVVKFRAGRNRLNYGSCASVKHTELNTTFAYLYTIYVFASYGQENNFKYNFVA